MSAQHHQTWKELDRARFATKTFVKASNDEREKRRKEKEDSLVGSEVKDFYEAVLAQDEPIKSVAVYREVERKVSLKCSVENKSVVVPNLRAKDLFLAAQDNDADQVCACLDLGLDVDSIDLYGWSALMTAACAGAGDSARTLIDAGADVSVVDKSGNNCLRLAKKNGHHAVADLIRKGFVEAESAGRREDSASTEERKSFYCEDCELTYKESTRQEHKASTVHQVCAAGPSSSVRTVYGIPESNRGFQMLLSSGWDRDGGLGSDGKKGKMFPVKTVLKRDRRGLGVVGANVARVTHFKANDVASVKNPGSRVERTATIDKKRHQLVVRKSKTKELIYSRELSGL